MKVFPLANLRNVVFVGPQGTGKTSLIESIFFKMGKISRKGDVASGNTITDFTDEEIDRKISIHLAVASLISQDSSSKINFIDTPGYSDFYGETVAGINVADNIFLVISSEGAMQMTAERTFFDDLTSNNNYKKPLAIIVNKTDKDNLDINTIISNLETKLSKQAAPLYVALKTGSGFTEVIDLINLSEIKSDGKKTPLAEGGDAKTTALAMREKLIEAVASTDEKLTERYLEGQEIKTDELIAAIKAAFASNSLYPVIFTSCINDTGIDPLLSFIKDICLPPSPSDGIEKPFSAIVFKSTSEPGMGHLNYIRIYTGKITHGQDVLNYTKNKPERIGQISVCIGKKREDTEEAGAGDIVALAKLKDTKTNDILGDPKQKPDEKIVKQIVFPEPLYERAIMSKNKGDEEKIGQAISNILLEHPTVKNFYRVETKEMILAGLGNVQLDVIAKKVKTVYHVDMELKKPRIPYKETVSGVSHVQGKYKRQSGGRGQYGDCWLKIEPKPLGSGYEFVDKIVGGVIPKNYIPSIEKGVKEAMEQGVIAGYPVVDIKVTVDDGSFHEVDSSDMAFKIAGAMALRKGVLEARPYILEPILNVEIITSEEYMGSVMGDLNSKRGRVMGMDRVGNNQIIKAQVPWGEMFEYLIDLKSLTRGTGKFKYSMSHYEMAPPQVAQPLIDAFAKSKTKEEEEG